MTDIEIEHPDGSTETITHVSSTEERRQNRRWKMSATTTRADANSVSLTEGVDIVNLVDGATTHFGGVLADVRWKDDRAEFIVPSFEQLSRDAKPTPPTLGYDAATDQTIVTDAIDAIPDLTAGTIETIETGLDITYYHASRALQIRRVRNLTGGEIRYNANKTVDYQSELGSDKTGTVISPANQNITRSPLFDERGGEDKKTHLRVIGAGGNSVDVTASSFSSGDRERWGRAVFKGVSSTSTLTTLGEKLLEDLSNTWKEVESTLTDLSPAIGDTYTVDYPELNIDSEELRVDDLRTTRDRSGTHHKAVLTNRSFARGRELDKVAKRASEAARGGQTVAVNNQPSTNFPVTEFPAGAYVDQYQIVPKGYKLYLWTASMEVISADATENTSVCLKLIQSPEVLDTEVYSQCISSYESGGPLAEIDATDSAWLVGFRVENTSSETVRASAAFSYTVEAVA